MSKLKFFRFQAVIFCLSKHLSSLSCHMSSMLSVALKGQLEWFTTVLFCISYSFGAMPVNINKTSIWYINLKIDPFTKLIKEVKVLYTHGVTVHPNNMKLTGQRPFGSFCIIICGGYICGKELLH